MSWECAIRRELELEQSSFYFYVLFLKTFCNVSITFGIACINMLKITPVCLKNERSIGTDVYYTETRLGGRGGVEGNGGFGGGLQDLQF